VKQLQKLKDKEVYVYDKDEGFQLYNPLSYNHKGYTIDKLYDLYMHKKDEVLELKKELQDLKTYLNKEGAVLEGKSLYDLVEVLEMYVLSSQPHELTVIEKDEDGYVVSVQNLTSKSILMRGSINTPQDVEKRVYRLKNGKFIKDEAKEAELWKVY
jgi:hypothetical protein